MVFSSFFLKKIILIETQYKTYDQKLLAIIVIFQTQDYYLEACKYKVFIFTDYNSLYQFINTKSLSFKEVC